jgi:hypothetical protein
MALIRSKKTIDKSQIKVGHVLEIEYDGDKDLILVIDPKAENVVDTSQGRSGKLHAIKLQNLVETDLADLIAMVRNLDNVNGRLIYDTFKSSPYSTGKRNYRTYTPEKIGVVNRISVGQNTSGTNKLIIGTSILYGVEHGSHVQLAIDDYDVFTKELKSINNTFYEGPTGHESVTQELMKLAIAKILSGESWEPSTEQFNEIAIQLNDAEGLGNVGGNIAGWWNQWIRGDTDGGKTATNNIKSAWSKVDPTFETTIRDAFSRSVRDISLIERKWKTYKYQGKTYDWSYVSGLLDRAGWNISGIGEKKVVTPTQALIEFNEAGHFQVFPEDNTWNMETKKLDGYYEEGELFEVQSMFNKIRDIHLVNMMNTARGIYFAGSGHLDNLRNMGYGR